MYTVCICTASVDIHVYIYIWMIGDMCIYMLWEAKLTCLEIPLQNHHLLETKEIKIFGTETRDLFGKNVCHYGIAHIKWRIVLGSPKSRDAWVVLGGKNKITGTVSTSSNVKTRLVRPCWGQIRRTSISADLIKNWPGIRWKLDLYIYRIPIFYPNENVKVQWGRIKDYSLENWHGDVTSPGIQHQSSKECILSYSMFIWFTRV